MINIRIIAEGITIRKNAFKEINQLKEKLETEEDISMKAFYQRLIELKRSYLEEFFAKMHQEFSIFGTKQTREEKLYLIFKLPVEGAAWQQYPKVENENATAPCAIGCSYMPLCGEIETSWVMLAENPIYGSKESNSSIILENSIDLDEFIDFSSLPIYRIYGVHPQCYSKFYDWGIANIPKDVTDIISQVEDIIIDVAQNVSVISRDELTEIIKERLAKKEYIKERKKRKGEYV